jgi:hypothetical protein
MIAIDATGSNDRTRFGGSVNYHALSEYKHKRNPYEMVMGLSVTLLKQDRDCRIPLYFFGSRQANACRETPGVLFYGECKIENGDPKPLIDMYRDGIEQQTLDGPTDFRPMIDIAIADVERSKQYTMLFIISDGGVNRDIQGHCDKLINAANYPLSITCVGIGDGNFDTMQEFDDLKGRRVDNFQFTRMLDVCAMEQMEAMKKEFFYRTFMEAPIQYRQFKKVLGYEPPARKTQVRRFDTYQGVPGGIGNVPPYESNMATVPEGEHETR